MLNTKTGLAQVYQGYSALVRFHGFHMSLCLCIT